MKTGWSVWGGHSVSEFSAGATPKQSIKGMGQLLEYLPIRGLELPENNKPNSGLQATQTIFNKLNNRIFTCQSVALSYFMYRVEVYYPPFRRTNTAAALVLRHFRARLGCLRSHVHHRENISGVLYLDG